MATTEELVHTMTDAANRAAQLYSIGEYAEGDWYARLAQSASDRLEGMVHEIGVS